MSTLKTYQIDRKLTSSDQPTLYSALSSLYTLFPTLSPSQSYFIPRLLKLFSQTPHPFIRHKISSLFLSHYTPSSLFTNAKDPIISTMISLVKQEGQGYVLVLKMVGKMKVLFKESLSMYHILLGKVTLGEKKEDEGEVECLGELLEASQYLSTIFTKNYPQTLKRDPSISISLLFQCKADRSMILSCILSTFQYFTQKMVEKLTKSVRRLFWRIVWREIPNNIKLGQFVVGRLKGGEMEVTGRQLEQLRERVRYYHPYLGLNYKSEEQMGNELDVLFEMKRRGEQIPNSIEQKVKEIVSTAKSISSISYENLLLLFYSSHNYDLHLSSLPLTLPLSYPLFSLPVTISLILTSTFTHLKILLTLNYHHTASKLINYFLNQKLSAPQYKRLIFYLKLTSTAINSYKDVENLMKWGKYRGENVIQYQYARFVGRVKRVVEMGEQNKDRGEVREEIRELYGVVKEMEERYQRVGFAGVYTVIRVLEIVCLGGEQVEWSTIQQYLYPYIPTHLLSNLNTPSQLISCLLYFPKFIFIHLK